MDVIGRCGDDLCARDSDCERRVHSEYKFYLSFENAMCRDYVTEKFFGVMEKDAVLPVVLGEN